MRRIVAFVLSYLLIALAQAALLGPCRAEEDAPKEKRMFVPFRPDYSKLRLVYTDMVKEAYASDTALFARRAFQFGQFETGWTATYPNLDEWLAGAKACQEPPLKFLAEFIDTAEFPLDDKTIDAVIDNFGKALQCNNEYGPLPDVYIMLFRLVEKYSGGNWFDQEFWDAYMAYLYNAITFYPGMRAVENSRELMKSVPLDSTLGDADSLALLTAFVNDAPADFDLPFFQMVFAYQCNYEGKYCDAKKIEADIFSLDNALKNIRFASLMLTGIIEYEAQNNPDMTYAELYGKLLNFCSGWSAGAGVGDLFTKILDVQYQDLGLNDEDVERMNAWWVTETIPSYMSGFLAPALSEFDPAAYPPYNQATAVMALGDDDFDNLHQMAAFTMRPHTRLSKLNLPLGEALVKLGYADQAKYPAAKISKTKVSTIAVDFLALYLLEDMRASNIDDETAKTKIDEFCAQYDFINDAESKARILTLYKGF